MSITINKASEEEIIIINELREIYDLGEKTEGIMFRKVDFKRLNAVIRRVNNMLRFFEKSNITETSNRTVARSV